jgi:peptidoglycan-associated lipoprotein
MKRGALVLLFMTAYIAACASDDTGKGGAEVVPGGRPGIDASGNVPGGRPGDVSGSAVKAAWDREVANASDANGAGDRVFFQLDQSDLSPQAQETLRHQADWLKRYSAVTVTIEGHADERGTREYNLALGDRRATTARNFLIAAGIPAERIHTITYGKERPAVVGSNEAAYSKNRRAVTMID